MSPPEPLPGASLGEGSRQQFSNDRLRLVDFRGELHEELGLVATRQIEVDGAVEASKSRRCGTPSPQNFFGPREELSAETSLAPAVQDGNRLDDTDAVATDRADDRGGRRPRSILRRSSGV